MKGFIKNNNKSIVSKYGNTEIVQTKGYITFKVKAKKRRKAIA